jgi:hypothetical protein
MVIYCRRTKSNRSPDIVVFRGLACHMWDIIRIPTHVSELGSARMLRITLRKDELHACMRASAMQSGRTDIVVTRVGVLGQSLRNIQLIYR